MLSVKNLVKKYKPKKGVPVTAINDVTLDFPDKGMVFLLGKSGSGKSTLLNLLGGLDKYDGGEIIIKGVSSKKFKQKHFDSYRNTYIGFIFQEYNILEEFSVGANIALAIELQGRKCSDDEINKILHQVDLDGYGNRKPNELSGGQKQRVAIARALVKNPEIIMADEPTGALDSNTGRQVFDTLKKLSSDKLVLVVSHDREFAEQYADRIIELADGKVINDVEFDNEFDDSVASGIVFEENCITVPAKYHLTAEDTAAINAYIDSLNTGIKLKIINASKKFKETKTELINQNYNSSSFKLIKSKLPMRSAFKIGVSGLKHKKVRLVFTILLSVVAFILFGIADTFGAYNHIDACTNSIIDSEVKFATVIKEKKFGEGINTYWTNRGYKFSDDEIKSITAETGNKFKGVYAPEDINLNFDSNFDTTYQFSKGDYTIHSTRFTGFMDITEADLSGFNASLVAGKLPSAKNDEIAISTYVFETFKKAGYIYRSDFSEDKESINSEITNGKKIEIKTYNDMVGKTLFIYDKHYTVTGIIDTGLDISRYEALTEENKGNTTDHLVDYLLYNELRYETDYGISQLAFVGEGKVKNLIENAPKTFIMNNYYGFLQNDDGYFEMFKIAKLSDFDKSKITWAGEAKNSLNNKEFIVTMDKIDIKYFHNEQIKDENGEFVPIDPFVEEQLNKHATFVELAKKEFTLELNNHYEGERTTEDGWKIVGYINFDNMNASGYYNTMFVSDEFFDSCVGDMSGVYNYLTSPMPDNESEVKKLVKYAYTPVENVRLPLQSAVTYELDMVNSTLDMLSDIFLYIGIGFAVFASLMLSNFISTSISYKKRDIGVLRAIGSRSNDVFRIFFSESFVIAFINFVFSSIGTFVVATIVNNVLRQQVGVLITILSFSLRQLILIFAVSLFVAASASYLPVKKIASKRPVDAIKNK